MLIVRTLPLVALALLAGCTTPQAGRGSCDAARVQNFVGALGTADLGTAARQRSGARYLRWLAPGTAATMDYRTDRLNLRIDGRNYVTALDCG